MWGCAQARGADGFGERFADNIDADQQPLAAHLRRVIVRSQPLELYDLHIDAVEHVNCVRHVSADGALRELEHALHARCRLLGVGGGALQAPARQCKQLWRTLDARGSAVIVRRVASGDAQRLARVLAAGAVVTLVAASDWAGGGRDDDGDGTSAASGAAAMHRRPTQRASARASANTG